MRVALVFGIVAVAVLAPTASRAARATRVHATISYTKRDGDIVRATLRITRGGALRLSTSVPRLSGGRTRLLGLRVRDLDGDGEPEVVLDLFTSGAHCCTESLVYRYLRKGARYVSVLHDWGNVSYRLVDLDRDGRPDLVSADDRFAYAFTSYADSVFPIRVWHYEQGRFVDVTRHFPSAVEADSSTLWKDYLGLRSQGRDVRGALAAWLADRYLLGQEASGWRRLAGTARADDLSTAYLRQLRAFLTRLGYARG